MNDFRLSSYETVTSIGEILDRAYWLNPKRLPKRLHESAWIFSYLINYVIINTGGSEEASLLILTMNYATNLVLDMSNCRHNTESIILWVLNIPELRLAWKYGFTSEGFMQSPYCSDAVGSYPGWSVLMRFRECWNICLSLPGYFHSNLLKKVHIEVPISATGDTKNRLSFSHGILFTDL